MSSQSHDAGLTRTSFGPDIWIVHRGLQPATHRPPPCSRPPVSVQRTSDCRSASPSSLTSVPLNRMRATQRAATSLMIEFGTRRHGRSLDRVAGRANEADRPAADTGTGRRRRHTLLLVDLGRPDNLARLQSFRLVQNPLRHLDIGRAHIGARHKQSIRVGAFDVTGALLFTGTPLPG